MNYKHLMLTLSQAVSCLKIQAAKGCYDGTDNTILYLNNCKLFHKITGTYLIFTRDVGYHSCGWFKNPDYERCYHLSLSFKGIDLVGKIYDLPHNRALAEKWIDLFFGDNKKLLWIEGPFSKEGKQTDCYHYRLFCDEKWQPIKPRKEVYSKDFTEKGWKSFSELKGE